MEGSVIFGKNNENSTEEEKKKLVAKSKATKKANGKETTSKKATEEETKTAIQETCSPLRRKRIEHCCQPSDDDYDEDADHCDMWMVKYRTSIETLSTAFSKVAAKELYDIILNKDLDVQNMSDTELFQLWDSIMPEICKKIETNQDLLKDVYSYWISEMGTYCPSCMPGATHIISLFQEKENVVQVLMDYDYYKRSIRYPVVLALRTKSLC